MEKSRGHHFYNSSLVLSYECKKLSLTTQFKSLTFSFYSNHKTAVLSSSYKKSYMKALIIYYSQTKQFLRIVSHQIPTFKFLTLRITVTLLKDVPKKTSKIRNWKYDNCYECPDERFYRPSKNLSHNIYPSALMNLLRKQHTQLCLIMRPAWVENS